MPFKPRVSIVGGTGALGFGLAVRFASAGVPIVIGSREASRAHDAAANAARLVPGGAFSGLSNADAVRDTEIVILSVPFRTQAETLKALKDVLGSRHILVDATVPLATAINGRPTHTVGVWHGSAAQQAQSLPARSLEGDQPKAAAGEVIGQQPDCRIARRHDKRVRRRRAGPLAESARARKTIVRRDAEAGRFHGVEKLSP